MKPHYQTILIVENDNSQRNVLLQAFHQEGTEEQALFLRSGNELLRYISTLTKTSYPNLIVLDNGMPEADGRETMRLLWELYDEAELPVMVYTSNVYPSGEGECKKCGGLLCLQQKQVTPEEEEVPYLEALGVERTGAFQYVM